MSTLTFCRSALSITLLALAARAQNNPPARCTPVEVPVLSGRNMFTTEQEQQLGEIFAEEQDRSFGAIDDDQITGHMQQIVDRLLAGLPAGHVSVRVFLTGEPVLNAWSIPGRIYVTRKMVAFTQTEDELAGLLAHELGHIVTRQMGVEFTERFRQALGVTEISDRQDLFNRYHELTEALMRDPDKLRFDRNQEQRDQLLADRTAVLMLVRAGYPASAFIEHFDRLAETKGKTGNWLSELFGTTAPNQKRLRELVKESQASADTCPGVHPSDNDFKQWQEAVLRYGGSGHRESVHGVQLRTHLDPALRGDIRRLRFSPDGQYILAQDYSSIWVLKRQPLMFLFRIDAPDALPASFTPDSSAVVFSDETDLVQRWSLVDRERTEIHQLTIRHSCIRRELSPDGTVLACSYWRDDAEGPVLGVALFDVETGAIKFEKQNLHRPALAELWNMLLFEIQNGRFPELVHMHFSPDNKYFVASARDTALALQLPSLTSANLPGQLKWLLPGGFVFVDNLRVAVYDKDDPKKSAIVSFPGGQVEKRLRLGAELQSVTKGEFVMEALTGGVEHLGIVDLQKETITMSSRSDGLDVYGDVFINDTPGGEVALYDTASLKRLASTTLPLGPLKSIHAFDVSPDGSWLAVSERTRGAVWNLRSGDRAAYIRGFQGAHFGPDDVLWADVASFNQQPRTIVRLTPAPPSVTAQLTLDKEALKSARFKQLGGYLGVLRTTDKGKGMSLEIRDITTEATLWTHSFAGGLPSIYSRSGHVVLMFVPEAAKREARQDTSLQDLLPHSRNEERSSRILEVLNAKTGQVESSLTILAAGGPDLEVAGDRLLVSERNRITSYSLSQKKEVGSLFGNSPVANAERNLLATANDRWHITLSDLTSLSKKDQFAFASPVAALRFSADGSKLYVLTQDQTFFVLSTDGPATDSVKAAMH